MDQPKFYFTTNTTTVDNQGQDQSLEMNVASYFEKKLSEHSDIKTFKMNLFEYVRYCEQNPNAFDNKFLEHIMQSIAAYSSQTAQAEVMNELPDIIDLLSSFFYQSASAMDRESFKLIIQHLPQIPVAKAKKIWHFVEFIFSRTEFSNTLLLHDLYLTLIAFHSIKKQYEIDKFAYILEKIDMLIWQRFTEADFETEELPEFIHIFSLNRFGSQTLFQTFHAAFKKNYKKMTIEDALKCAWGLVNYTVVHNKKIYTVFNADFESFLNERKATLTPNSLIMYLWARNKEQEFK